MKKDGCGFLLVDLLRLIHQKNDTFCVGWHEQTLLVRV